MLYLLDKLIRRRMSSTIYFKRGSQGFYYTINKDGKEFAFDGHFPILWAMRELKVSDFPASSFHENVPKDYIVTGAFNCKVCEVLGSFNGVITSYCINCLTLLQSKGENCGCLCMYHISSGKCATKNVDCPSPCESEDCCFKTYLKGVNLWEIGDREMFEKRQTNWRQEFVGSEEDLKKQEEDNVIFEDYLTRIENEDILSSFISSSSSESSLEELELDIDSFISLDDDSMPELVEYLDEDDDDDDGFYRR